MEETLTFKLAYDSIVLFDSLPFVIKNDEGKEITIWGILYNKQDRHDDDLWIFEVNRYISYLKFCQDVQYKGGRLSPDEVELPDGNIISLQVSHKNLLYRLYRDKLLWYTLVERDLLDLKPDEVDESFLISDEPLKRMKIDYGRLEVKKDKKNLHTLQNPRREDFKRVKGKEDENED